MVGRNLLLAALAFAIGGGCVAAPSPELGTVTQHEEGCDESDPEADCGEAPIPPPPPPPGDDGGSSQGSGSGGLPPPPPPPDDPGYPGDPPGEEPQTGGEQPPTPCPEDWGYTQNAGSAGADVSCCIQQYVENPGFGAQDLSVLSYCNGSYGDGDTQVCPSALDGGYGYLWPADAPCPGW